MTKPLLIVVKGFPRVSETFVTRELERLQKEGVSFGLASLRRRGRDAEMVSHSVAVRPNYLPEYLHEEPLRVARSFGRARSLAGFALAWRLFRADFSRDASRNRLRRFGQACVLAAEVPTETRHIHAHFIHTPASVTRYAAAMRGITFSVSAHAKDIWTTPDWDLAAKMRDSKFVCACNENGAMRLNALTPGRTAALWPHTVLPESRAEPRMLRPGPVRLVTVARAVPKKGLELLLDALALMPSQPEWSWTHIGGGDLLETLRARAESHPYRHRIEFLGVQPHDEVLRILRRSDIFLLTAGVSADGDRDGRPNALIEAMTAGLACVATSAGGIPELLTNGSGILTGASANEIATALAELMTSPERISELGVSARRRAQDIRADGERSFFELARALREASGQ
jgi:glycosyltransferase involved in cell wall biosynthesis